LCDELRRSALETAPAELARLRRNGYSIVESMYVVVKVFNLSPADAKALAVAGASEAERGEIGALHDRLEEDVQG
jgi:hypothetical protein